MLNPAKLSEVLGTMNIVQTGFNPLFRVLQTYVVNFICQKVQHFQADSGYVGKINNNFFFNFFFQCLALPKDRQKLGEVQKKGLQIFFNLVFYLLIPYESPILGQLLDLISPTKINLFQPRFKSYDPWDMAN